MTGPVTAKAKGKRKPLIMLAAIVLIIFVLSQLLKSSPTAVIRHKIDSMAVLDSSHVRVWTTWTNTSSIAGTVSCTIQAQAYNAFGDPTGLATDSTGPNGNLKPHGSQFLYQDLIVSGNDAAGVTLKDITISNCA